MASPSSSPIVNPPEILFESYLNKTSPLEKLFVVRTFSVRACVACTCACVCVLLCMCARYACYCVCAYVRYVFCVFAHDILKRNISFMS